MERRVPLREVACLSTNRVLGFAAVIVIGAIPSARVADSFADPIFAQRWQQDEAVTPNFWGPLATAGAGQYESYLFAAACPQQPPGMPRPCDPPGIFTRRIVHISTRGAWN